MSNDQVAVEWYEVTDGNGWSQVAITLEDAKTAAETHHGGPMYWGEVESASSWSPPTCYAYVQPYRDPWEDDEVVSAYRVQVYRVRPDGTIAS